jgi:sortase A
MATTEQEMFANQGRRFLSWTRWLFVITGIVALSYVGLILLNAQLYQNAASNTLDQQIQAAKQHIVLPSIVAAKEGDVLGKIKIPRLGLSVAVLQGTSAKTLLLGVGHIAGTALPGQPGNVGIAGHRDTYFRALKEIRQNDVIELETAGGVATYGVDWIQITAPSDSAILTPSTDFTLTLVTCYPFHYIGAAPGRYVVHARRQM